MRIGEKRFAVYQELFPRVQADEQIVDSDTHPRGADHRTDRVAFLIKNAQGNRPRRQALAVPVGAVDRIDDERVWSFFVKRIDCFFTDDVRQRKMGFDEGGEAFADRRIDLGDHRPVAFEGTENRTLALFRIGSASNNLFSQQIKELVFHSLAQPFFTWYGNRRLCKPRLPPLSNHISNPAQPTRHTGAPKPACMSRGWKDIRWRSF